MLWKAICGAIVKGSTIIKKLIERFDLVFLLLALKCHFHPVMFLKIVLCLIYLINFVISATVVLKLQYVYNGFLKNSAQITEGKTTIISYLKSEGWNAVDHVGHLYLCHCKAIMYF